MEMESITYAQEVFESEFDKEKAKETRTIPFIVAAEITGKKHRNHFNYNWDKWSLSNFNANPIVGYQHNVYGDNMCLMPDPDDVIAKAVARMGEYKGKRAIIADTTFEPEEINETAEKIFQKVLWGSLRATSIGIIPIGQVSTEYFRDDNGNVTDYQINMSGQDMLEFSIVNIPADPNALRRSMKSHTLSALNFVQRLIPELSLIQLKSMKVQEILDILEKNKFGNTAQLEIELKTSGADPELNKYIERLNKFKNGQAKS